MPRGRSLQNSELYRRGIVMPMTQLACNSLLANDVDEDTEVRWLEIQGQRAFDDYWSSGVFQRINASAGTIIDDYEEEVVQPDLIGIVKSGPAVSTPKACSRTL